MVVERDGTTENRETTTTTTPKELFSLGKWANKETGYECRGVEKALISSLTALARMTTGSISVVVATDNDDEARI